MLKTHKQKKFQITDDTNKTNKGPLGSCFRHGPPETLPNKGKRNDNNSNNSNSNNNSENNNSHSKSNKNWLVMIKIKILIMVMIKVMSKILF